MRVIRCDQHPDREAVITISVRTLPLGSRPIVFGFETVTGRFIFDLCEECSDSISPNIMERITNASSG